MPGGFDHAGSRCGHINRVVAEIGHAQVAEQTSSVRLGARGHAELPVGCDRDSGRQRCAVLVEEFVRTVGVEPGLEDMQVCVGVARTGQRYLMGAPRALGPLPIDFLRTRPALRGTENDHRPHRTFHVRVFRRLRLDSGDFVHDVIEDRRETRMDRDVRFVVKPGDEDVRLVAVTPHECIEFCVADSRQHRWIGDLVTVQVKDRQNHPVGRRVQELVGVPAGGERSGLGLAVTDNGCDEKMRIVECRPIRVGQRVAEFATLVDGARCLRRDVRGDSARKGELLE